MNTFRSMYIVSVMVSLGDVCIGSVMVIQRGVYI